MKNDQEKKFDPSVLDALTLVQAEPGFTCYPWETTPDEYLAFAKAELETDSTRARINAIAHAKRAIHSHVDFLLHNCGRCLRSADFPTKLELLQRLGIVAPAILKKYNRLRNVMEHEYRTPTESEVEDVVDVAELFLKATLCYGRPLPDLLAFVATNSTGGFTIDCDWDERRISMVSSIGDTGSFGACTIEASSDQELWMRWVARILALMQEAVNPYTRCQAASSKDLNKP